LSPPLPDNSKKREALEGRWIAGAAAYLITARSAKRSKGGGSPALPPI
jgi:hypothetical protein